MQPAAPIDIYARVSRLRDKDQTSTPAQIQVCRGILVERGLQIGEEWDEPGRSAWNPKVYRKKWEAMMARLESGEAGGVIVYDLERFARQMADGERLIRVAERGILVLDSEGEYDLRKPGDRKNFRNAIVAAAYYSDLLRTKVKRGKQLKAANGKVDMRRSFGFEDDGITVRQDEADIIRDMAARLLAGETQDSLIKELNERGVPTTLGAKWRYSTFRQVMIRPRNAGLIQYNGEIMPGVRLPGEPVLDQLTHDRIIALYAARKWGRPPSGRYLLTGIAVCGQPDCGAALSGRPLRGSSRYPRPERRQYYCHQCRHTFIDVLTLDNWAADWTIRTLADPVHAEAMAAAERELGEKRAALETEAAGIETTLREMADKLGHDQARAGNDRRRELLRAEHEATRRPLLARLDAIDSGLATLAAEEPAPTPPGRRTIDDVTPPRLLRQIEWLAEWEDGGPADKRAMVLRALAGRRIVVGPGKPRKFDPDRVTVVP